MCGSKLQLKANRNYIRRYFKNFQVTGCTDSGGTFLILWFLSFFLLLWGSLSSRPISQPVLLKSHICPRGFVSLLRSFLTSPGCGQNVDNGKKKKKHLKRRKKQNRDKRTGGTIQLLRNGNEIPAGSSQCIHNME